VVKLWCDVVDDSLERTQ